MGCLTVPFEDPSYILALAESRSLRYSVRLCGRLRRNNVHAKSLRYVHHWPCSMRRAISAIVCLRLALRLSPGMNLTVADVGTQRLTNNPVRLVRLHNQCVRLALPGAVPSQVLLHVGVAVLRMTRIREVLAARGLQPINPREAKPFDILIVQAHPYDLDIGWQRNPRRRCDLVQIRLQVFGDGQSAWIEVTEG